LVALGAGLGCLAFGRGFGGRGAVAAEVVCCGFDGGEVELPRGVALDAGEGAKGAGLDLDDERGEEEDRPGVAGMGFGEGFLPVAELGAELFGVVAEFEDGVFEGGVVCGGVPEVAFGAEAGAVGGLEVAELGLVGGGIGMVGVPGEIEEGEGGVFVAGGAGEEDVGFFALEAGVEELELGVGDAGVIGIDGGGLGPVGVASELDEGIAGVDFFAKHLAEVAAFGAEDVLLDDFVAEEFEDVLDLGASGFEFAGDGGDEDAGLHGRSGRQSLPSGWNGRGEGWFCKGRVKEECRVRSEIGMDGVKIGEGGEREWMWGWGFWWVREVGGMW
jgi:hypothetical protein